jgi:hypothetical protein
MFLKFSERFRERISGQEGLRRPLVGSGAFVGLEPESGRAAEDRRKVEAQTVGQQECANPAR